MPGELLSDFVRAALECGSTHKVEIVVDGVRVIVAVKPAATTRTPCERDILLVVLAGGRLTTAGVIAALDVAGMLHGDSTVKLALSVLVRAGLLTASRHAPCGYAIA